MSRARKYLPLLGKRIATFTPLSLSPVAWWDFGDVSTLFQDAARTVPCASDGDIIGGVRDKSGFGRHLSQSTTANKPQYRTAILNGKSIGNFDATDYLVSVGSTYVKISIFMVWKSADTNAWYIFSLGGGTKAIIQGYTAGKIEWYSTPRTVLANISTTAFQNIKTTIGSAGLTNWNLPGNGVGAGISPGKVAEVLVYSGDVGTDNATKVNNYILGKWGV